MSQHRIAVISDTHGMLRPEVCEILRSAELILHGGDITSQEVLDRLSRMARVIAVRGNGDKAWAGHIPEDVCFDLYGRKVYMIHNRKKMSAAAGEADIVIYGHSHRYEETVRDGKLWLNPGSCGPARFGRPVTMALLVFGAEDGPFHVERIELCAGQAPGSGDWKEALGAGTLQGTVKEVVRDLEKGRTVGAIVESRGISRALAEQICQIYFTHPGIDAEGVLNRIEITDL